MTVARLIPAWAGKTLVGCLGGHQAKAHPRVGGENHAMHVPDALADGSSPRGRGKRGGRSVGMRGHRLIPAWAGKTASFPARGSNPQAHPRVGGENQLTKVR